MVSPEVDFEIGQGATVTQAFPLTDQLYDTTGWALTAQIRATHSTDVLAEFAATFETVDAELLTANGYPTLVDLKCLVLRLDAAETGAFDWVKARYDLRAVKADIVAYPLRGFVYVVKAITHD